MIYCIYSDKEIRDSESNIEHIIPLSLGGSNQFTIPVSEKLNSALAKVDGKVANDFLIKLMCAKNNTRGYSKKEIIPILKSSIDGKPAQISFKDSKINVYDPIDRRYLNESELTSKSIKASFKMDQLCRIRFVAKTILSAGYFIYGDLFIHYIDHDSLRKTMNAINLSDIPQNLRGYDEFMRFEKKDKDNMDLIKMLCDYLNGSAVIFELSNINVIAHVSILGHYIGTLNIRAKSEKLPNEGEYRLGHVAHIQCGQLFQKSFWQSLYDMNTDLKLADLFGPLC